MSREQGGSFNERHQISREQQEGYLQEAKTAAASGDPIRMLKALHQSYLLDGLTKNLRKKFLPLSEADIEILVSQAIDVLYQNVSCGKKITNPANYLYKVANNKATSYYREWKKQQRHLTVGELENLPDSNSSENLIDDRQAMGWEVKRAKAIAHVRSLLPRLGQSNVQAVMSYILKALEANRMDLTNAEIAEALELSNDTVRQSKSRGFKKLKTIVEDEGFSFQETAVEDLLDDLDVKTENSN